MSAGPEEDLGATVIGIAPPEAQQAPEAKSSGAPAVSAPETDTLAEDLDRLDPVPSEMQLHDGPLDADGMPTLGTWVRIERLRTRQFFSMLRIITRSAIPALGRINLDPRSQTEEDFVTNLVTVLLLSIPEADEETLDFLTTMVTARDAADAATVAAYMRNPELDDTVELVQAIVRREGPDLRALGKRMMQMFTLAQKTGQTKELETAQAGAESSGASDSPST